VVEGERREEGGEGVESLGCDRGAEGCARGAEWCEGGGESGPADTGP
jgi:hypothetical protein